MDAQQQSPDAGRQVPAPLTVVHPTPLERVKTWTNSREEWGTSFSLDEYVKREAFLMTIPTARQSGISHWILTDAEGEPDDRPVYATCESLRKRMLVAIPGKPVFEGVAHGLGSVFTYREMRGRGYATALMRDVAEKLKDHQGVEAQAWLGDQDGSRVGPPVLGSFLYSDVGPAFYARKGWMPFHSSHFAFPLDQPQAGKTPCARGLKYHEVAPLCCRDEEILREKLARLSGGEDRRTRVALIPDLDAIQWHLMREDFTTNSILSRTPSVRGAIWDPQDGRGRVWATWVRSYYGDATTPGDVSRDGNTLHILRLVVEDECMPIASLAEGFCAVLRLAIAEAVEWRAGVVEMWESGGVMARIVEASGLRFDRVERKETSIPSLMWYGRERADDIEWVANEKFGWC